MPGVITDPVADFLTRIRNGLHARHSEVVIPHSKLKAQMAEILVREGYIEDVEIIPAGVQSAIKVKLKYTPERRPTILGLKRISKPGLRVYKDRKTLPQVQGGLGIAILSTSRGVMTDRDARRSGIGGEILAEVW
jgi:small subunit ribosomal protein S8